jgi:rhodanese-related sulfurtransferase
MLRSGAFVRRAFVPLGRTVRREWSTTPTIDYSNIEVSKDELTSKFGNPGVMVIDVRSAEEVVATGALHSSVINIPLYECFEPTADSEPGALKMDEEEFRDEYGVDKPNATDEVIFTCKAGIRSHMAVTLAQALGFSNARHYPGGSDGFFSA